MTLGGRWVGEGGGEDATTEDVLKFWKIIEIQSW